jgi:hypothetical protein
MVSSFRGHVAPRNVRVVYGVYEPEKLRLVRRQGAFVVVCIMC